MNQLARGNNTREGKQAIRFATHNRKPGSAKFWKHRGNRSGRRRGGRINRDIVEETNQRADRAARQSAERDRRRLGGWVVGGGG